MPLSSLAFKKRRKQTVSAVNKHADPGDKAEAGGE